MLISIIIAVYNNEAYLPSAVESVISQGYPDCEVIIVDDGSTDNTPAIADGLADSNDNVRVIHQKNQWIYASFNNGIKEAKGEYIYILNSDDRLLPGSLEKLDRLIKKYEHPDVIWTQIVGCLCDEKQQVIRDDMWGTPNLSEKYYPDAQSVRDNWVYFHRMHLSVNQANLYKRKLAADHPFRNDVYGADMLFNISIADDIKNCVVAAEPVYQFFYYDNKRNASVGKYYGYEHSMFSEMYLESRSLLTSWGIWQGEGERYFSKRRYVNILDELKALSFDSCKLNTDEKIMKILSECPDEVMSDCAHLLNREEELESRILFDLRERLRGVDVSEDDRMYFVKAMTDDFTKYDEKSERIRRNVDTCLDHPDNPFHVGRIFYQEYLEGIERGKSGKKRALWLCNVIIPEFSGAYGMKAVSHGGWISGMLKECEKKDEIDVALVFPVRNENRMRDGYHGGHRFFSFHQNTADTFTLSKEHVQRFAKLVEEYRPDIVHIWGTEYPWAEEMMQACERTGITAKVLVYIQGLVSVYARSFRASVPEPYYISKADGNKSIEESREDFIRQGENEVSVIRKSAHVAGRTDWDLACVQKINPKAKYHRMREILRAGFYENAGKWTYGSCEKHRIFVSQASYPVKGFHYMLDALSVILGAFPDTQVYVGGISVINNRASSYARYLSDELERLSLGEHVHFIGRASEEEMVAQYLKANVFVSPSSIENSCNSVCEALLIGVPVVSSFVGGMSNLITHEINGLLYPERETELMASYIIKLFTDQTLCEELSQNGTEKARDFNSREGGYKDLMDCYREVMRDE